MRTGTLSIQRRAQLLLVEDDAMVRRALERGLSDVFHVTAAEDGAAALRHIEEALRVDVILTDIRMPNLDGLGFHRVLQAQHSDLARRTVFMSGSLDEEAVHRELVKLDNLCIAKPFSVRALQQQLIQLLERWGMNDASSSQGGGRALFR